MKRWIVAMVIAGAGRAAADDEAVVHEHRRLMVSAPVELGYQGEAGFALGIRPELILAYNRERIDPPPSSFGIGGGVYGHVQRSGGATLVGAGLTLVLYKDLFAVAPSVGVYRRADADGVAVSLFAGARPLVITEHLDLPFGVRIEARTGGGPAGDETTWTATAELDVLGLAAVALDLVQSIGAD